MAEINIGTPKSEARKEQSTGSGGKSCSRRNSLLRSCSQGMRTQNQSVVVKRELNREAKLSISQSTSNPSLMLMNLKGGGYKWSKMNLFLREAGFPLSRRVRSSVVREELGIQSLPVHMERSQLRLLGHLGTSLRRCLRQALPEVGLR